MGIKWETVEPKVWKPEVDGDSVTGVYINKVEGSGDLSNRYYLENRSGQLMLWGSAVLDDRMSLVKIGSLVRITYHGKQQNKKGQPVNIYSVSVGRRVDDDEVEEEVVQG